MESPRQIQISPTLQNENGVDSRVAASYLRISFVQGSCLRATADNGSECFYVVECSSWGGRMK